MKKILIRKLRKLSVILDIKKLIFYYQHPISSYLKLERRN